MKKIIISCVSTALVCCGLFLLLPAFSREKLQTGYLLEKENSLAREEPGTHDGGGMTTGYNFFNGEKDFRIVYKKRILHPGSSIGYHLQKEYEIYHVLSGEGEMKMNGSTFPVSTGDAILTYPGSSHGLKVTGESDLTIMIVYEKK